MCELLYIHVPWSWGISGGLITSVCSLMLSLSLPVYQVRLDWLLLHRLDSTQPAELPR